MTYRQASTRLAQHLVALVSGSGSRYLDDKGFEVALLGRRETVRLMQESMAVATRREAWPARRGDAFAGRVTIQEAVDDPVHSLQRVLDSYPVPTPTITLTEVTDGHLTSEASRTWKDVARWAVVARHYLAHEQSAYSDGHRWSVIADAAATAPVVRDLDRQLVDAARRIGPGSPPAAELARAIRSPAALMAAQVESIARRGALPDLSALQLLPTSARPVRVDDGQSLLEAQRRIPFQLRQATEIRPDVIARTALGQARVLLAVGDAMETSGHRRSADLARDIAAQLGRTVQPSPSDLASLTQGDTTPLEQTEVMLRFLRDRRHDGHKWTGTEVLALHATVHQSPTVIEQLSKTANAQLSSGRWMISYAEGSRYAWDRHRYYDDDPRLITGLRQIRQAFPADQLAVPAKSTLQSLRSTLRQSPTSQASGEIRPDSPAQPLHAAAAKTRNRSKSIAP